jgi:hypothetical protein
MEAFKKLIEKKKKEQGGEMDHIHAAAKGSVLHDLMSQMDGINGEKVKGLKKVVVASNDKEGLEHGLDKAKSLLGKMKDDSKEEGYDDQNEEAPDHIPTEHEEEEGQHDEHEVPDHEATESPEEESAEHDGAEGDNQEAEDARFAELEKEHAKLKAELEALKRSRMY